MGDMYTFKKLAEKYSLIPMNGKVPIEKGWGRWCTEKRSFVEDNFEDRNAGIPCGPGNGVLVVDVDDPEAFAALLETNDWDLPETMQVQTGRSGYHNYYAYPDDGHDYRSKSYHGPDRKSIFDVRGLGGAAVAPGSIHPETGNPYVLIKDIDPAPAPQWLKDYVLENETASEHAPNTKQLNQPGKPGGTVNLKELDVPEEIKDLIREGAERGLRSDVQWKVLKELLRAGIEEYVIFAIFDKYAIGHKYRGKGQSKTGWLQSEVERARQSVAEEQTRFVLPEISKVGKEANLVDMLSPHIREIIKCGNRHFVRIEHTGQLMTLNLMGGELSGISGTHYFKETGKRLQQGNMQIFQDMLKAKAMEQDEGQVFIRLARVDDIVYLDLADKTWAVVEISENGWRMLPESPVPFWRSTNMLPLPMPVPNGDVDELRELINCPEDDLWLLIKGWLLGAANPDGPYYLLNILGNPGSGKSSLAKLLQSTLDPNRASLMSFPASERDLAVMASNGWILSFDNLSSINGKLSDAMCRIATGGAIAPRQLYADNESYVLEAKRPVILTAINNVIRKGDLADRAINVELPPVLPLYRIPEREISRRFQEMHPRLLGALCTAISKALINQRQIRLPAYPRMVDATIWICASEVVAPHDRCAFLDAYLANRRSDANTSGGGDPLVQAVVEFMNDQPNGRWEGSASELLSALRGREAAEPGGESSLPRQPNQLSGMLSAQAPVLDSCGIRFEKGRNNQGSRLILVKQSETNQAEIDEANRNGCEEYDEEALISDTEDVVEDYSLEF